MSRLRLTDARCPTCGPRLYFITHWEQPRGDERHDIPCEIDIEEIRGESYCACGEIILMATEPADEQPREEAYERPDDARLASKAIKRRNEQA